MNEIFDMTPWGLLHDLLNIDTDQLHRVWKNLECRAAGRFPPVNVYLDDNATIIDVELPGKAAKDVDLTLEAQAVVIADKPADTTDENGKAVPVKPSWSRRVELPFRVDHEKANAKFINGILRIELPRADAVAAHRIKIA